MSVDPNRVRDLFLAASELPPDRRPEFLADACGPDVGLRAEVERLLAAHADPASLLDPAPPSALSADAPGRATVTSGDASPTADHPTAAAGGVLAGRYTLLERIGEGGMGEVWVAKQTEPVQRKVALKLIKAGMDSRQVVGAVRAGAAGAGADGPPEHRQGARRRADRPTAGRSSSWSWSTACR